MDADGFADEMDAHIMRGYMTFFNQRKTYEAARETNYFTGIYCKFLRWRGCWLFRWGGNAKGS